MNRREFIAAGGSAALWVGCSGPLPAPKLGRIMTVRGAITQAQMGTTLPHEHVLVDFTPASRQDGQTYSREEVVETMLPYLLQLRDLGVRTFVDATPSYVGRDATVLRALSERSGLHILTNTGYYGARDDAHVPEHAFEDTPEALADRWIAEWDEGIGDTGILPGFIKIGVDPGSLSDIDAKLVHAAGLTHLATGLTIASHTGPADSAFEEMDILEDLGVHASAWIWVHAQAEEDLDAHVDAALRGAWIEFDGVSSDSIEEHVALLENMRRHGLLSRTLISQDAGWYTVGEEEGGDIRGYATLFTEFLPALRKAGFSEEEITRLIRDNPADAFRIRVRVLHA